MCSVLEKKTFDFLNAFLNDSDQDARLHAVYTSEKL